MANTVQLLKPGTLVVTPGDRDDIILAASLAAMNGMPPTHGSWSCAAAHCKVACR